MADPTTVNRSFAIPTTGSDIDTWGTVLNTNWAGLDTMLGAPTSISTTGGSVTLTAPQLLNGSIFLSGTLVSDALIIFPAVQGWWTIYNGCTVGTFGVFVVCGTQTVNIGIPPGEAVDIVVNVNTPYYRGFGRVGGVEIWAGLSALPRWCSASTVPPYVICDGTIYNISVYPALGARLGTTFGGNGLTTFGVPDLRGRVPLPYDGTGARITAAVSGINGQTLGAAGGDQNPAAHTHPFSGNTGTESAGHSHSGGVAGVANYSSPGGATIVVQAVSVGSTGTESATHTHAFSGTTSSTFTGTSGNVPPAQVTGLAVIRAA